MKSIYIRATTTVCTLISASFASGAMAQSDPTVGSVTYDFTGNALYSFNGASGHGLVGPVTGTLTFYYGPGTTSVSGSPGSSTTWEQDSGSAMVFSDTIIYDGTTYQSGANAIASSSVQGSGSNMFLAQEESSTTGCSGIFCYSMYTQKSSISITDTTSSVYTSNGLPNLPDGATAFLGIQYGGTGDSGEEFSVTSITAVPAPPTFGLLVAGLAGVVALGLQNVRRLSSRVSA